MVYTSEGASLTYEIRTTDTATATVEAYLGVWSSILLPLPLLLNSDIRNGLSNDRER